MRSLLIALGVFLAALLLWLLVSGQQALRRNAAMLPLTFAHADHRNVNCVECHHNFVDRTGHGLCFECHQKHPAVSALMEAQFHALCRDCHLAKQRLGEDGGPVRRCLDCHRADDAP